MRGATQGKWADYQEASQEAFALEEGTSKGKFKTEIAQLRRIMKQQKENNSKEDQLEWMVNLHRAIEAVANKIGIDKLGARKQRYKDAKFKFPKPELAKLEHKVKGPYFVSK